MAPIEQPQPLKTLRGTWNEILSHSHEIPEGSQVEVRVFGKAVSANPETATMTLLRSWLEEDATDNAEEVAEAEADLLAFKRGMNAPRKEAGTRLPYPEAE